MNKTMTKILAALLVGVSLIGLLGCSANTQPPAGWNVWSTYNTTKVIQQTGRNDTYQKMDAQLSAQMMRNEYEGAQLIITAKENITYMLTAGILKNQNGDIFPAENIEIYHQKYQTIKTNFNGDKAFQAGDSIPDMLLPLDIAAQYGENKIAANTNQGVTVEFHSKDVPAGVYTGNFTLDLNGQKMNIPVSVEVWDFQLDGRREFQSCFVLYRDEVFTGEFCNTDEIIDTYVDKLLDYKINTLVAQSYYTPQILVKEAQRLFQNPNFNSLAIPCPFYLDYQVYENAEITPEAQEAIDYITALAKASSPEANYIQYAYFYLGPYDEADVVEGRWEPSEAFLCDGGPYQQTLALAIAQLKAEGWFDQQTAEFAAQTEAAILQIPAVFTNVNFVDEWVGTLNAAFCPYISHFNDTAILNQYRDAAEDRSFGDLWAYTCCGPVDPYPTFHIDDGTLDMRVCGWMEKAYGITGYLYYKVNNYAYLTNAPVDDHIDMYATPARYFDVNGDGFLFYPGRYYGSSEPFATVRLAAYRDGMDEYDMLCIYEQLLQEYAQQNNIADFDFHLYVEDLYRSMFQGMVAKQDAGLLYAARKELANRILTLKNEGRLAYDPLTAKTVTLTSFENGMESVVIKSEYKDGTEEIGSKTKMFRPCFGAKVSDMSGAKTLSFTYENTGDHDILMQIVLVTGDMEKITVDTSYCGVGKTRQVRIQLPEGLANVTEIRLTFDNVKTGEDGQTVLQPDRAFTVTDFVITM